MPTMTEALTTHRSTVITVQDEAELHSPAWSSEVFSGTPVDIKGFNAAKSSAGDLTAIDPVTGEITSGRVGKIILSLDGSYSADKNGVYTIAVYKDIGAGYVLEGTIVTRSINSVSFGSFAGSVPILDSEIGHKYKLCISTTGTGAIADFAPLTFKSHWEA